ncbi:MAG: SLBB domain-containing protein, partial [Chthoniobacterales bacterium]
KLSFIGSPELNGSQKIRVDGRLNLPLIGEVQAAGKTITALQVDLSGRYKSQLQSTDVLVTLESSAAHVTVSGAIAKPTTLTFDRPTTVLQAIMEAGGPNPYGNLKSVRLIRTSRGQHRSEVLNVDAAMKGLTTPFYVRDGDIIYVPQSIF